MNCIYTGGQGHTIWKGYTMKLVKTVRQVRDLMVRAAGNDSVRDCNSILLENIMDDDMSVVRKIRQRVSSSLLNTASVIDPAG